MGVGCHHRTLKRHGDGQDISTSPNKKPNIATTASRLDASPIGEATTPDDFRFEMQMLLDFGSAEAYTHAKAVVRQQLRLDSNLIRELQDEKAKADKELLAGQVAMAERLARAKGWNEPHPPRRLPYPLQATPVVLILSNLDTVRMRVEEIIGKEAAAVRKSSNSSSSPEILRSPSIGSPVPSSALLSSPVPPCLPPLVPSPVPPVKVLPSNGQPIQGYNRVIKQPTINSVAAVLTQLSKARLPAVSPETK